MLELLPNCECCDRDLPPDSSAARIRAYECTFLASCADGVLAGLPELRRQPDAEADQAARHAGASPGLDHTDIQG